MSLNTKYVSLNNQIQEFRTYPGELELPELELEPLPLPELELEPEDEDEPPLLLLPPPFPPPPPFRLNRSETSLDSIASNESPRTIRAFESITGCGAASDGDELSNNTAKVRKSERILTT